MVTSSWCDRVDQKNGPKTDGPFSFRQSTLNQQTNKRGKPHVEKMAIKGFANRLCYRSLAMSVLVWRRLLVLLGDCAMAKLKLPSFFRKMPHIENLTPFKAAILRLLAWLTPFIVAGILIQHIGLVLIVLSLGWIPYSVWLVLCVYFKWKDNHKKLED